MRLTRLVVQDVRVIRSVALELHGQLNVLVGGNGAGKSSLLEAVHLLGTGRSFRTREIEKVVRAGAQELSVFGEGVDPRGTFRRVGVTKGMAGARIRLDGEDVRGVASIARVIPLAVFGPESLEVVEGAPERRRALVDWALFHVEQGYGEGLQRYRRAVRQRNALLRASPMRREARIWEEELVQEGERLDRWRTAYIGNLAPRLSTLLSDLWPRSSQVHYRRGWASGMTLQEALERSWEADRARGWTGPGAHAADLIFRIGDRQARDVLSRGERKIFVAATLLAHVAYIRDRCGNAPIILADDIPSELDEGGQRWFLERLRLTGSQIFATALQPEFFSLPPSVDHKMFHVERGVVRNLL